jgi:poly [ADP-ribose] polymerase
MWIHNIFLGKGLYFYDTVSKAASNCYCSRENPEGLLVLCEVALGNIF